MKLHLVFSMLLAISLQYSIMLPQQKKMGPHQIVHKTEQHHPLSQVTLGIV